MPGVAFWHMSPLLRAASDHLHNVFCIGDLGPPLLPWPGGFKPAYYGGDTCGREQRSLLSRRRGRRGARKYADWFRVLSRWIRKFLNNTCNTK